MAGLNLLPAFSKIDNPHKPLDNPHKPSTLDNPTSPERRRLFSASLSVSLLLSPHTAAALDLDPLPSSFVASSYYLQTLKVVGSLQESIRLLDERNEASVQDSEISSYVQATLFPLLKKWAQEFGFQPGVIKYQKRGRSKTCLRGRVDASLLSLTICKYLALRFVAVYQPPGSYTALLSVFDELKKTVSQPKPGQPIERVRGEECEIVKAMLEEVVKLVKDEVGYVATTP